MAVQRFYRLLKHHVSNAGIARRVRNVTILIVRGPHHLDDPWGGELATTFESLVRGAGQVLSVCACSGLRELVAQVRAARAKDTRFVLLDPGDLAEEARKHPEAGLDDALGELASPYVEVHDDSGAALQRSDGRHAAPLATIIINGDLAASYRIALGIALRRLAE